VRPLRRVRRFIGRVTGVEAAIQRRVEAAVEHAARQARVQRRRAQGAEKLYRTNRRRANELAALVRVIDQLPRWQYGSVIPGKAEWADKWEHASGLKILMFAKRDYSGSFYKWADAINNHSDHAARLVVTAPHQFGYQLDLVLPNPDLIETDWPTLWSESDVLHIKDETGFMDGSNRLPPEMLTSFDGPKIFTQYGGYARKHKDNPAYRDFVLSFDRVVSMTPDLCFEWLGPHPIYVPHSIDCHGNRYQWVDSPLVGHSPSTRARKGTEEFLIAVQLLADRFPIELDLIEGVSHLEAVQRKRHLGLFFDQAGREMESSLGISSVVGWYGNSALEAAVYGVPTIAHLSEEALVGAERAGVENVRSSPIVNTPLGAHGIADTLRRLFEMTPEEREQLARETRRFVETFHSQEAAAFRLENIYQDVMAHR